MPKDIPHLSPYHKPVPSVGSSSSLGTRDVDKNSRTSLQFMALGLEEKFSDGQRLCVPLAIADYYRFL